MMETLRTSETSVDNYFTWQYIPEDNSELHIRRRENMKSHMSLISSQRFFPPFLHFYHPYWIFSFVFQRAKGNCYVVEF
jgi:type IV secretory pathway component VirB8